MKVEYRRLFLIGLGFLVINTFWSVYNSYVPIFLREIFKEYRYTSLIVGALLTLDNIAAITLQPFFGALSDNTWNKLGRRMPYIIFGLPFAALAFILIPLARTVLPLMLLAIAIGNVAMAVLRAPTVALMPDITPSHLRSKANGVINLMGGLGALIAYFLLSSLYKKSPLYPFLVTSLLMVAVAFALYYWVREEKIIEHEVVVEKGPGIIKSLVAVFKDADTSARNILLAIFFWFAGWSAVEAFFTTYGVEQWELDPGTASFYLGFFSLSFLICAIPSGFIASKFGRRKTIQVGVAGLGLILAAFTFIEP
ncbi:MAG: major facilitator superfamily MFS1, partial [Bacillota bacterium]